MDAKPLMEILVFEYTAEKGERIALLDRANIMLGRFVSLSKKAFAGTFIACTVATGLLFTPNRAVKPCFCHGDIAA
jgi:hypothetical protein